jgi:integrase
MQGCACWSAFWQSKTPGFTRGRFTGSVKNTLATGLGVSARFGEAVGLTVGDLDLERGWVHIRPNAWRPLRDMPGSLAGALKLTASRTR